MDTEKQLELFPRDHHHLPTYIVNEIAFLGQAGWKAAATAAKLGISYNVVRKYYKRFGVRMRVYRYRKNK